MGAVDEQVESAATQTYYRFQKIKRQQVCLLKTALQRNMN
jgi:hypothetical protein